MEKGTHSMANDLWQSKVKRLRTLNFLLHGTVLFGQEKTKLLGTDFRLEDINMSMEFQSY